MSTPVSFDQQWCPIARGLELLGDRWTLLVVRELSVGPQRFGDLQRHLPGIAATVLSDRLKAMAARGLVEILPGEPAGRHHRYALGPDGHRALPVLASLFRFGMPLLEPHADDRVVRPSVLVRGAIAAYHDPAAAAGVDERYAIRTDGEAFTIDSRGVVVADTTEADLVVTAAVAAWIDVRQRRARFDTLVRRGVITCVGSRAARDHFCAIYRLRPGRGRAA